MTEFLLMLPVLMPSWLDPYHIIQAAGPWALWVVAIIVFLECGLWPVLPGDSLLFAVGMLCAMGVTGEDQAVIHYFGSKPATLAFVIGVLFIAAIGGNIMGYWVGRGIGPALFKPREGWMGKVFSQEHLEETHRFFIKYGAGSLILARFVPFVRTFVTMIAGIGKMDQRKFYGFSAIGAVLWVVMLTVGGFYLGRISFIRQHIETVLIAIIFISVVPMLIGAIAKRRKGGPTPPVTDEA